MALRSAAGYPKKAACAQASLGPSRTDYSGVTSGVSLPNVSHSASAAKLERNHKYNSQTASIFGV